MRKSVGRETKNASVLAATFIQFRAAPHAAGLLGVFLVAAYLSLANLDYAGLWYDEGPAAVLGNTLLEQGSLRGWDGRNLVGADNGRTLNSDLIEVLPPLAYGLNAVGIALFGFNEVGARAMHALVGLLSLVFLYLLLREHLRQHPRLILFIFLFSAWSAQLLLYFRQSRYYAFMVFGVIAAFYLYERYWQSRNGVFLVLLTLVATLAFLNHYVGGTATILSIAAWHLLFRARQTTGRECLLFGLALGVVALLGTGYLVWLGVIGGERGSWIDFMGIDVHDYTGDMPAPFLRVQIYARDLFAADWISWPVFLWFVGMLFVVWRMRNTVPGTNLVKSGKANAGDLPVADVARIVLMGLLFALFSALLSVQQVWVNPTADLRYCVGALPLLLAMKGLLVEWTWRKSRILATTMGGLLLMTSIGAAPFNMVMEETKERTLGAHFFQFAREIHQPYPDAVRVVAQFLLERAERDDLVHVPRFEYREPLTFYAGHHVRFCCVLDELSPLPRHKIEALGAPLYVGEEDPDWIVLFGDVPEGHGLKIRTNFEVVAAPNVHHRLTHRPELNYHAFTPLAPDQGVYILRKRTGHRGSPNGIPREQKPEDERSVWKTLHSAHFGRQTNSHSQRTHVTGPET